MSRRAQSFIVAGSFLTMLAMIGGAYAARDGNWHAMILCLLLAGLFLWAGLGGWTNGPED